MAKLTARLVEQCRERFEAGDPAALLDAVDLCARAAMPMPLWLAEAFCERFNRWERFEAETLDAAFDVERPTGKHLGKRKDRERLRHAVVFEVERRHRDGAKINDMLFEDIGQEFKIGRSKANKIYYEPASVGLRKLWGAVDKLRRDA
jgi:hypothetical protein